MIEKTPHQHNGCIDGGAMFSKAIDASDNVKDVDFLATIFLQVIKKIEEANVIHIITDNASNYKATGLRIETRYPHIFWIICAVHNLNLALKTICDSLEKSPQYVHYKWNC